MALSLRSKPVQMQSPAGSARARVQPSGRSLRLSTRAVSEIHPQVPHAAPALVLSRRAALASAASIGMLTLMPNHNTSAATDSSGKLTGRSIEEVKAMVESDFVAGQYYVTGKLTKAAFDDKCVFIDPTTTVTGVEPYTKAVSMLFDASTSRADLISLKVVDDKTLKLRWRLEGTIMGKFKIKPYTGTTLYTLNDDGLISRHYETWDYSAVDVFVSCFLPNFGAPAAPPVEELRAMES